MLEQFFPETTQEDGTHVGRNFCCRDGDFLRSGDSLRSRLREIEIGDGDDPRRRDSADNFDRFVRVLVLRTAEGGGVLGRDCEWMVSDFLLSARDFPGDEAAGDLHDAGLQS